MMMNLMAACMLIHVIHGATLVSLTEDTTPVRGTSIGSIDTTDEMQIDLVFTINSFGDLDSMVHVGNENGIRSPSIWLLTAERGFYCTFSNQANSDNTFATETAVETGVQYTLQMMITQSRRQLYLDGVEVHDDNPFGAHDLLSGQAVYVSDPWYNAADITIHSLAIYDTILGLDSINNNAYCDSMDIDYFLGTCSAKFSPVEQAITDLSSAVDQVSGDLTELESTISENKAAADLRVDEVEATLNTLMDSLNAGGSAALSVPGNSIAATMDSAAWQSMALGGLVAINFCFFCAIICLYKKLSAYGRGKHGAVSQYGVAAMTNAGSGSDTDNEQRHML